MHYLFEKGEKEMVTNASDGQTTMHHGFDLRGLSSDTKPTDVPNGSSFLEMDTGEVYVFDEESATWFVL